MKHQQKSDKKLDLSFCGYDYRKCMFIHSLISWIRKSSQLCSLFSVEWWLKFEGMVHSLLNMRLWMVFVLWSSAKHPPTNHTYLIESTCIPYVLDRVELLLCWIWVCLSNCCILPKTQIESCCWLGMDYSLCQIDWLLTNLWLWIVMMKLGRCAHNRPRSLLQH